MEVQKPETIEGYIALARQFAWLADIELKRMENAAKNGDLHAVARRLPGLISIVNTVGYLRGQDGFFIEDRPQGMGEYQKELYATEDAAEQRLWALIELVCQGEENRQEYLAHLRTYYLQARTPRQYR